MNQMCITALSIWLEMIFFKTVFDMFYTAQWIAGHYFWTLTPLLTRRKHFETDSEFAFRCTTRIQYHWVRPLAALLSTSRTSSNRTAKQEIVAEPLVELNLTLRQSCCNDGKPYGFYMPQSILLRKENKQVILT